MPDDKPSPKKLLSWLKAARRLPSPPGAAARIVALCERHDVELREIADVTMADPALAARLLRYANSPIAGVGRPVCSVRDAVVMLGMRRTKLTALGFCLPLFDFKPAGRSFDLKAFWSESFLTAVVARRLMAPRFNAEREEAFTAGLLAGVGRLTLACGLPAEYDRLLDQTHSLDALLEAERNAFGVDHAQLGAQLLADWELPSVLVEAVAQQYAPSQAEGPGKALAEVVHRSRPLAEAFLSGPADTDAAQPILQLVSDGVLEEGASWDEIVSTVTADCKEIAELFDIDLDDVASALELYSDAQEQAIRIGMVAHLERSQAVERSEVLFRRATTDSLTGLYNRTMFDERLSCALAGLHRGQGHFALLLFDIDHYKRINDEHGHSCGDMVLKRLAVAVQSVIRDVDVLARYGGDEFVVLAPNADHATGCLIAERIRGCVEALAIPVDGKTVRLSISIGLVNTSSFTTVPDATMLFEHADVQLYRAKEQGRNRCSCCGHTLCDSKGDHGDTVSGTLSSRPEHV